LIEFDTARLLKRFDLLKDRRLAYVKLLGCLRDASISGNRLENLELV
jgi:hypothetical protein